MSAAAAPVRRAAAEPALAVGAVAVDKRFPPLTRAALALYAGASGDHNPMHIDSDFARAAGFPDVFAQGMLAMAYLAQALTDAVPPAAILRFSTRFAAITRLGDALRCRGEVVELAPSEDGRMVARIALAVLDGSGELKLGGEALVDAALWEAARGRLDGKVALVSGSGRGIGRAIALKLAGEGARVVVNDLDADPAREAAEAVRALGAEVAIHVGDATAPDFGDRYVAAALDAFGGLDMIVNNAGYTWDSTIGKMSDEQFQAMLDVHLLAPFRILRAASEPIRVAAKREAADGREVFRKVVNVSSIAGLYGNAGQAAYSSAKSSLVGLTRTLAKEWGRHKVNVNCVAFGLIETRLTQAIEAEQATVDVGGRAIKVGIQPQLLDTFARMIPLGRAGTPQEAADAVYLFCCPESNYVSGQVLVAGGGLLL